MGLPPVDRSTLWPFEDGEPGEFYYQRYAHPTGVAAERALGELEGGEALLFSSGSGATTALVLALLKPGDTIAVAEGCYYGTPTLFRELERWGLEHVEFDQTGPPPDGVQLVWLEAPSNPFLTMPDFEAAAAQPRRSSSMQPPRRRSICVPLDRGADLVLHSATKYLERPLGRAARRGRHAVIRRRSSGSASSATAPESSPLPMRRGCSSAV